jgi:hypothetical protein
MPGGPHSGSKVWKAPDREIGKSGKNSGKVIAHRDLQPTAAFHDRENRTYFLIFVTASSTSNMLSGRLLL